MMAYWLFALLLAGLVFAYLWAERRQLNAIAYFCKPAATVTVIILLLYFVGVNGLFVQLVLAALILSLLGDIFLMLPSDRFIPGLASFFLAHIAYIAAFVTGLDTIAPDIIWSLPIVYGVALLWFVWPQLQALKIPVVLYAVVIMAMLLSTIARYQAFPSTSNLLLLLGAIIFVLSDSLIALDKFQGQLFKKGMPRALTLIIVTYFVAQFLLVTGTIYQFSQLMPSNH
ncbi:MAG: lysoplasmalogenase [Aestuariibacter sp.]